MTTLINTQISKLNLINLLNKVDTDYVTLDGMPVGEIYIDEMNEDMVTFYDPKYDQTGDSLDLSLDEETYDCKMTNKENVIIKIDNCVIGIDLNGLDMVDE